MKSKSEASLWLWLVLVAAVYAVAFGAFPVMIDNWIFETMYLETGTGDTSFSLSTWLGYVQREYEYDNARLAQMVAPLISMHLDVWRWPVAAVLGVCMSALVAFAARMMCGRLSAASVLLTWLCLTFVLPWRNWMVGELYAMNYVIPCAAALWALCMMRGNATFRLRCMLPLLLLCAWGHECIGLAMACGMLGYMILRGFRVSPKWWIAMSVCMAAALFFVLGVGMRRRIGVQVEFDFGLTRIWLIATAHFMCLILAAAYLCCLMSRRRRQAAVALLKEPVFVVASASALTLMVVNMFTGCQSRYGFMPQLTSVIAFGILLRRCYGLPSPQWPVWGRLLCGCVLLLFWTTVSVYQFRKFAEYRHMHQVMRERTRGDIVMEFEYLDKSEPWLLNIPMRNLINNEYDVYCLSCRYPQIDHEKIRIVHPDGTPYMHK